MNFAITVYFLLQVSTGTSSSVLLNMTEMLVINSTTLMDEM
jgi:hypothetical protein